MLTWFTRAGDFNESSAHTSYRRTLIRWLKLFSWLTFDIKRSAMLYFCSDECTTGIGHNVLAVFTRRRITSHFLKQNT